MGSAFELGVRVRTFFLQMSDQTRLTLVITGLVGFGLVVDFVNRTGGPPRGIHDPRVLVAQRDLPKGTLLTQLDLTTVLGTEKEAEKAFTDQQLPIVLGSRLRFKLRKGERLEHDTLELARKLSLSDQIPLGYRAYSFHPENDLPVQMGDRIDILSALSSLGSRPVPGDSDLAQSVATDVEIIDLKRTSEVLTLVVAVAEVDLPKLEKARQSGKLVFTLRSSKDLREVRNRRANISTLRKQKKPRSVELLVEGEK